MDHLNPGPKQSDSLPETFEPVVNPRNPCDCDQRERAWNTFCREYTSNQVALDHAASIDILEVVKKKRTTQLRRALNNFTETARVVSNVLAMLEELHPELSGPIQTFNCILTLDITGGKQNYRILAVMLQMQSTMCALFSLRLLGRECLTSNAKVAETFDDFCSAMQQLANDIIQAGSDLTYYRDAKPLLTMVNAGAYEKRLAKHLVNFRAHKEQFQNFIQRWTGSHPTGSFDTRSQQKADPSALETQQIRLDSDAPTGAIDMDRIFRFLDDNPAQRERLASFVSRNGGPKECIESMTHLRKILIITRSPVSMDRDTDLDLEDNIVPVTDLKRSPPSDVLPDPGTGTADELRNTRNLLRAELASNLDEALESHLARFRAMLNVQGANNRRTSIDNQVVPVEDTVLQSIWHRVGLKANMKATHFVQGLRDHLISASTQAKRQPVDLTSPAHEGERWILPYLHDGHTQPLLEAMDEDISGTISAKEAQVFSMSRPSICSLPEWCVYWAVGWHLGITTYRSRIYSIIQSMHRQVYPTPATLWDNHHDLKLFANRAYLEEYLDLDVHSLELLLRSTRPFPHDLHLDERLIELSTTITNLRQQEIAENLERLGYTLRSVEEVTLVIGSNRVEASIYPLLYLLLRRHVDVMHAASRHLIDSKEMDQHHISLECVFRAFDRRMRVLEESFVRNGDRVCEQYEVIAHGMFFETFSQRDAPKDCSTWTLLEVDDYYAPLDLDEPEDPEDGSAVLSFGVATPPTVDHSGMDLVRQVMDPFTSLDISDSSGAETVDSLVRMRCDIAGDESTALGYYTKAVSGYWSSSTVQEVAGATSPYSLWHCIVEPGPDLGSVVGKGESHLGQLTVRGQFKAEDPQEIEPDAVGACVPRRPASDLGNYLLSLDVIPSPSVREQYLSLRCTLTYDPVRDTMTGSAVYFDYDNDGSSSEASSRHGEATDQDEGEEVAARGTSPDLVSEPEDADDRGVTFFVRTPAVFHQFRSFLDPAPLPLAAKTVTQDRITHSTSESGTLEDLTDPNKAPGPPLPQHVDEPVTTGSVPTIIAPHNVEPLALARRRWKFAYEAIRYFVRERLGSSSQFHTRMRERGKWVRLGLQQVLFERLATGLQGYSAQMSEEDYDELGRLRALISPTNARLYEALVGWLSQRSAKYTGWGVSCDGCGCYMSGVTRLRCLTCVRSTLQNQIDICTECINLQAPFARKNVDKFNHLPARHSLIRTRRGTPRATLKLMYAAARDKEAHLKEIFRRQEDSEVDSDGDRLQCICCENEVQLPCMICIECEGYDTVICWKCEKDHESVRTYHMDYHSHLHHTLFLRTSGPSSPPEATSIPQIQIDGPDVSAALAEG